MSPRPEDHNRTLRGLTVDTISAVKELFKRTTRDISTAGRGAAAASQQAAPPPTILAKSGRAEDRSIGQPARSDGLRTFAVVVAFLCAVGGGIGFLYVFWSGGTNLLLGVTVGISFGALGCGLVLWAHLLMEQREATEPREPLLSPRDEREDAFASYAAGEHQVQRRKLLVGLSTLVAGTFAAVVVSMVRAFGKDPYLALLGTVWKRGQGLMTLQGKHMTVNSLRVGDTMTVFPPNRIGSVHAQTVLIRVNPEFLQLPKNRANWAPGGYVAYSRVCTHAGCPVGEYEDTTNLLLCPCHQSTFNVLNGGVPTGGPAARNLPQLPLYVDSDGTLRAAGDFSAPPGPGFWNLPPTADPGRGEP
jgi:ubiquinol-cytochrome c reductase iron-sulfur subunit